MQPKKPFFSGFPQSAEGFLSTFTVNAALITDNLSFHQIDDILKLWYNVLVIHKHPGY
jgi:hypothetical protein